MLDAHWLLFTVASLVLIATPGQDMILVMSRSVAQGPRAGVATAAGVSLGLIGHTVLATLGLGAILAASEVLFTVFGPYRLLRVSLAGGDPHPIPGVGEGRKRTLLRHFGSVKRIRVTPAKGLGPTLSSRPAPSRGAAPGDTATTPPSISFRTASTWTSQHS